MSEEEMKALVEMNNMLKHENEKLKQDKQELKRIVEAYKDKEDKLREIFKDHNVGEIPAGLSQCTYEITVGEMKNILQILNEGDK